MKIADVYVRGEYDGYGGVEINVTSNSGFGDSPAKSTVMAYHEQFREYFEAWQISGEALLATEIYCEGQAGEGHHPAHSLRAFLLKKTDPFEGKDRYCAPKEIRVQTSLHLWHLASLPKAMASEAKKLHGRSLNAMNVSKETQSAKKINMTVSSPKEW